MQYIRMRIIHGFQLFFCVMYWRIIHGLYHIFIVVYGRNHVLFSNSWKEKIWNFVNLWKLQLRNLGNVWGGKKCTKKKYLALVIEEMFERNFHLYSWIISKFLSCANNVCMDAINKLQIALHHTVKDHKIEEKEEDKI